MVWPSAAAAPQRKRIVDAAFEIAPLLRDAWHGFAAPEADIRAIAAGLPQPIWFAWAKSDRVIPLRYALPAIAHLKNARVTRFRGGHSAFLERPQRFTKEFLKFTKSLELEKTRPQTSAAARRKEMS
jgi:4,5:9,10-diseco-3-hydroxy-5,9,17-trioxoandrosta-1(10),2-diene-4-oate hydrolase